MKRSIAVLFSILMNIFLLSCSNENIVETEPTPISTTIDDTIIFQNIYGGIADDEGTAIINYPDGGALITGYTDSYGNGGRDLWLLRIDNIGDTLWTKTYGGIGDDYGSDISLLPDGGALVVGSSNSLSLDDYDLWILRLDNAGDTLWTRKYGGNYDDHGASIGLLSNGDAFVVGEIKSFYEAFRKLWLLKLDSLGNTLVDTVYESLEWASDISILPDDRALITASNSSSLVLLQVNTQGRQIWEKTYNRSRRDIAYDILSLKDGSAYITGSSYTEPDYTDLWLLRTNSNGDTLWTQTFRGRSGANGKSMVPISGDGVIVAGFTYQRYHSSTSDLYLVRVNSDGDTVWEKRYIGEDLDVGNSMCLLNNGNIMITGFTNTVGEGGKDLWAIRLDSTGNI